MRTTAVIVGAGHAGLAMSRRLTERSVDHVVLDRSDVADSWRTKRWPGLRLLTPNWMFELPGRPVGQLEPDGFLAAGEVADLVSDYARRIDAPVHRHSAVQGAQRHACGYEIRTSDVTWQAQALVIATGANAKPFVPDYAAALPCSITQRSALDYRGPDSLPDGGVLVVGASATGVQIAAELRRAGRPVTLAVGEHVRLPRTYRGRDIFWWLHATGVLGQGIDEVDDLPRARRLPSPQLVGAATPVDLAALAGDGVRLAGRLAGVKDGNLQFSATLRNLCTLADLKMARFLQRADEWAKASGMGDKLGQPSRPSRTPVPDRPRLSMDLVADHISTIVWATGFQPDYSWLNLPVLDRSGRLNHIGGVVTDAPGLYALGLPMLRTRASTYIYGAAADTAAISEHLLAQLGRQQHAPSQGRARRGAGSPSAPKASGKLCGRDTQTVCA